MMKSSVEDFLAFTKQRLPDIEPHLLKAVSTEDDGMNLRQLQKQMIALSRKLDGALTLIEKSATKDKAVRKDGGEADDSTRLRASLSKAGEGEMMPSFMDAQKAGEDELPAFMQEAEKAGDEYEFPVDEDTEKAETEKAEEAENEQPTTEGEEEEVISAGSPTPIGGKRASKRERLNDPVLKIGKHSIRKSAIGSSLFDILKSQQDEVERLAKQAEDERDLRELVEFSKVAEDELPHLPGTIEEKAVILKRLSDVLTPDERTVMSRMLKAGNAGVGTAFSSIGHRNEVAKRSTGDFTKRVSEIRARDNCSNQDAMRKARREYPEEYAAHQGN